MFYSLKLFWKLVIALIILLVIKFSADYFSPDKNKTYQKDDIEVDEIQNIFLSSLNNYDISDKLIENLSNNKNLNFKVRVYSDVPIELILLELERNFSDKNVTLVAKDSIQNIKSNFRIYLNEEIKLTAEFTVDTTIKRNKGKLAFLIKIDRIDKTTKGIVETSEPISFLIVPDKSFQRSLRLFKDNNKRYYILISNEINDLIYKFGKNYSKLQTKNTVYNILRDFEHSNHIFFDSESDWLDENTFQIISYELKRNQITLIKTSTLSNLSDMEDDISTKIIEELSEIQSDEKRGFIITPKQYLSLSKIFPSLRKTGYKIVSVNEILK
jgi:hypothetical protein